MILENYQQQEALKIAESKPANVATVAEVSEEGITLLFPGDETPSIKKYKYNKTVTFTAGQRVLLIPSAGSYVVAFPI